MKSSLLVAFSIIALGYEISDFQIVDPSREECAPQECLNAIEDSSWDQVVSCRDSSGVDCEYTGVFTYKGDAMEDLAIDDWEGSLIAAGVPPIKSKEELQGYYITNEVKLHLNFGVPDTYAATDKTLRRCIYMLAKVSPSAPTVMPPQLGPDDVCEVDGIPIQYRINSTLQVGFLLDNTTATTHSVLDLRSLFMFGTTVNLLVEPLANFYLENVTLHGDMQFSMTHHDTQ